MGSMPPVIALYREQPDVQYMALAKEGHRKGCIESSSSAGALSPTTNFIVETAKNQVHATNWVHIRSPFNNKYLCRVSEDSQLVAAAASEPVEDSSKWNCTLFQYNLITNHTFMIKPTEVTFTHIGNHNFPYAVSLNSENVWEVLKTFGPSSRAQAKFILVDVQSIVRLPKRVTFKGDNDMYLQCTIEYTKFTSTDNADEYSLFEIIPDKHGNVSIKSMHLRKIMRIESNNNVTWVDNDTQATSSSGTWFEVLKVSSKSIALRSLSSNTFLKRDKNNSGILIDGTSIVREARFIVEEPVFERSIEVHFRLKEGRIYERTPLQAATATVVNRTNKETTIAQGFNYTKTHTAKWDVNGSLTLGVEAIFESGIPYLLELNFKVSAQGNVGGSYGQSNDFSQQVTSTYTVTAPPMTKAIVKGFSQQAKYDIPFSYYVTEHYTNGEKVSTLMEDGMYYGVETYDFYYEASYEKLDDI